MSILRSLAAIILVSVAAVLAPTAAFATPSLPAGDSLYGLHYDSGYPYDLLYSIDVTTGVMSDVGTPRGGFDGPLSAAYNQADGFGYYLLDTGNLLAKMNLDTGASSVLGVVTGGVNMLRAIGITPAGLAYVVSANGTNGADAKLFSLDLSTLVATPISTSGTTIVGDPRNLFFNSSTGSLEVLSASGVLYSVDATAGTFTEIARMAPLGSDIGAQVDATGLIWASNGNTNYLTTISRSGAVLTPLAVAPFVNSVGSSPFIQAMFLVPAVVPVPTPTPAVVPEPTPTPAATLATTGSELSLLWVGGAGAILLAGIAVLRLRARRL